MLRPEPTIEAYRKFARLRIDAVTTRSRAFVRRRWLPPVLGQLARAAHL